MINNIVYRTNMRDGTNEIHAVGNDYQQANTFQIIG